MTDWIVLQITCPKDDHNIHCVISFLLVLSNTDILVVKTVHVTTTDMRYVWCMMVRAYSLQSVMCYFYSRQLRSKFSRDFKSNLDVLFDKCFKNKVINLLAKRHFRKQHAATTILMPKKNSNVQRTNKLENKNMKTNNLPLKHR